MRQLASTSYIYQAYRCPIPQRAKKCEAAAFVVLKFTYASNRGGGSNYFDLAAAAGAEGSLPPRGNTHRNACARAYLLVHNVCLHIRHVCLN